MFRSPGAIRWPAIPTASTGATWSDYLDDAVLQALRVASDISGQPQVNALGFCVGGTMLASALALAEARGQHPVSRVDAADLAARLPRHRRPQRLCRRGPRAAARSSVGQWRAGCPAATWPPLSRSCGPMWSWSGTTWSATTWKGQKPPADRCSGTATAPTCRARSFPGTSAILISKTTSRCRGRAQAAGLPLDLDTAVDAGVYFCLREDHIVPGVGLRFHPDIARTAALRAGGLGAYRRLVNPPAKKRRSYWVADNLGASGRPLPGDPNAWLAQAQEKQAGGRIGRPGSRGIPASRSRHVQNQAIPGIGR